MADALTDPYKLIVESVRDYALLLLDATGRVTSWNPGGRAITGYAEEEILGKHFSIFYPEEDAGTKPANELEVAVSRGRFEEEAWRIRKDGSRFWASVVLTPVKDIAGAVIGYAKVTRDLTERKQAEEEREAMRKVVGKLALPVIRLWPGIVLMPVVGEVEAAQGDRLIEKALERVVEEQAKILIVDVAGVAVMSTHLADAILKTASAIQLVGARMVLTGIRAEVARTMVRLGVDLSTMETANQLADGFARALALLGRPIGAPR